MTVTKSLARRGMQGLLAGGLLLAGSGGFAQALPPTAAAPSATAPSNTTASDHAGFLKTVRGNVQLLGASGEARPAVAGDRLGQVDRLVTQADSAASVVLRDGTMLVVGPSSRLDVKAFHFDATTQDGGMLLSLLRGSLRMITGLIGKVAPDAVRIDTPTATIGIRGTDFLVLTDGAP